MPLQGRKAKTPQPSRVQKRLSGLKTPQSVPPPKKKSLIDKNEEVTFTKNLKSNLFNKRQKADSDSDDPDSDDVKETSVLKSGQKRKSQAVEKSLIKNTPKRGKLSPAMQKVTPPKSGGKKAKVQADSESDEPDSDDMKETTVLKSGQKRKSQVVEKSLIKNTPKRGKLSPVMQKVTPAKSGGKKAKLQEVSSDDDEDDDDDDDDDESDDEDDDMDGLDDDESSNDDSEEDDENDSDDGDDDVDEELETEIQNALSKQMKKSAQKSGGLKQKAAQQTKSGDTKSEKPAVQKGKAAAQNVSKTVNKSQGADLNSTQNEEEIRKEERNRRTLFVKNLPANCTAEDVQKLSSDIISVRLKSGKKGCRGFCFVEFMDEKTAEKNYKNLQKAKVKSRELLVDYMGQKSKKGKTLPSTQSPEEKDPLKLYVTGFDKTTKVDSLKALFPKAHSIDFPVKKRTGLPLGYAFIKYNNAADAKLDHSQKKDAKVDGRNIVLLYSKKRKPELVKEVKKPMKVQNGKAVKAKSMKDEEEDSDDDEEDDDESDGSDEDDDEEDSDDEEESDDDDDSDDEDDSDDDEDDDDE